MSDNLGRYHFLSWARRGVAAAIDNPDQGSLPDRAKLKIHPEVSAQKDGATSVVSPPDVQIELFGPGDIAGHDVNHVIRTEPRDGTVNFEPNYLCGIEFDLPDSPWM